MKNENLTVHFGTSLELSPEELAAIHAPRTFTLWKPSDGNNAELLKAAAARDRAEAVERADVPREEPSESWVEALHRAGARGPWNTPEAVSRGRALSVWFNTPPRGRSGLIFFGVMATIAAAAAGFLVYVLSCPAADGCRP